MTIVQLAQPLQCSRCGHTWRPRTLDVRQCPKCKSAFWNQAKTK